MNQRTLLLLLTISLFSCDKNDPDNLLTGGSWILETHSVQMFRETVNFSGEGDYTIETYIPMPGQLMPLKGTLTGRWARSDTRIDFLTTILDLPEDTAQVTLFPYQSGEPAGAFYGYLIDGIYRDDSTLIDSAGSFRFSNLRDRPAFQPLQPGTRFWEILRLTKDSLVVECNLAVNRYYRKR
ncbi:MAG: hypothetical protein U0T82_12745 [Bacteroidales bacterium]